MPIAAPFTNSLLAHHLTSKQPWKRTARFLPKMVQSLQILPLGNRRQLAGFQSGEAEIDRWVNGNALRLAEQQRLRVFCLHAAGSDSAIGLYGLSLATEPGTALRDGREQSIWLRGAPLVYVAYLAIHRSRQNAGLGQHLLVDALARANRISRDVAFYGVGLRSLNDRTTRLYSRFGFSVARGEDGKSNPLMLLPIWTINDLFRD